MTAIEEALKKHIYELERKLAITEKALELACTVITIDNSFGEGMGLGDIKHYVKYYLSGRYEEYDVSTTPTKYIEYFEEVAKEIMKSEYV